MTSSAILTSTKAKVAIVNDTYIPECLGFREVLDPTRSRFRVKGIPVPSEAKEAPPANDTPSIGSLPIKATGKGKFREIETQRSEDEDTDYLSEPPINELREDSPVAPARNRERDALDDLVEEAKALKNLVGYSTG
ncbi:hypothetical protein BO94DRAFT_536622 [Aspergillus sclerotioniger CBS 115572]|uniref:Uncharacterized protein n=1 Tax=Aspergillus sclerotioniger CBS 115572 TaxID=1450535 RepID=A0A317WBE7_9EURO|nr:hypothetical protein BO94DRAFT_536622 [Aspergillus sclerotioniger CBS 115572]PWY83141.1 hypothetical protein BO94DRAFT_536622 [Aspergillus sclerotioniger CBS 115572]